MQGGWIEDLTWPEVKQCLDAGLPVLLPIGAAAKTHGHHLPMQTDYLTARALAERAGQRVKLLIAPVVGFGYYPAFVNFAGSQSLSAETFEAMLVELMARLLDQGARKLVLLNTGVSTERPVDAAIERIAHRHSVQPMALHMRLLGKSAEAVLDNKQGGHADERETSMMLAIAPHLVHLERATAEADQSFERSGATGDPRHASAAKGEVLLNAKVDELVAALEALQP